MFAYLTEILLSMNFEFQCSTIFRTLKYSVSYARKSQQKRQDRVT